MTLAEVVNATSIKGFVVYSYFSISVIKLLSQILTSHIHACSLLQLHVLRICFLQFILMARDR